MTAMTTPMIQTFTRWLCSAALAACLSVTTAAQDPPAAPPDAMREAKAVLLASYPELGASRIDWRATASGDTFMLQAHAATVPFAPVPIEVEPLVSTSGVVNPDGTLRSMAIDGALSGRGRLQALQARAAKGEPVGALVRGAGGRFVPGDATSDPGLVPGALARAARVHRTRDVTFTLLEDADGAGLTWRAEVDVPGGRQTLVFEPVEGRLIGLVRR
jgi:hypothetical protein